jgi:predicted nucleic acid-binding protein
MTCGIDTDFLVAVEVVEHPFHAGANALLDELLQNGDDLALAPQTLAEFIHVVTDSRRLPRPLSINAAIDRAEGWWNAQEVVRVYPVGAVTGDFLKWLRRHQLGRKRLLDTLLASTLFSAGVRKVITNNEVDFRLFGCLEVVSYSRRS